MKNLLYSGILFFLIAFYACQEAEQKMFAGPDGIYFKTSLLKADTNLIIREDTIVYSFAFDLEKTEQVVSIPVEITGFPESNDRIYHIKVVEAEGTQAGVHYQALNSEQVFHKGKTVDSLQVLWYRKDMNKEARKLDIWITDGSDFVKGLKEGLYVRIQVSDILEEPDWWKYWKSCLGEYHPVKYKEWMKIWGGKGTLPKTDPSWFTTPQEVTAMIELKRVFKEAKQAGHPFVDENENELLIPCPF